MKYFGHIARRGGDSLEKVIMQGCVEGKRKPGRPRTRWIDQIKSMVGCPLHELYNLVQDMLLIEGSYENMQKSRIFKILRAPSIRHQGVCL